MALSINSKIPSSLQKIELLDQNENAVLFEEVHNGESSLIVFIRHFGCIGCTTQMLSIGPKVQEIDDLGVQIKIIGNGEPRYIEGFIEKFNLKNKPVQIFTDPSLKIYAELELNRSFWHFINPVNLWQYIRGYSKGLSQNSVQGDNLQMGGAILLSESGNIEFYFANKTITGIADTNEIMQSIHKFVLKSNSDLL